MFKDTHAFSGFSVDDQAAAKKFYSETLGIEVQEDPMGLSLKIAGSNPIFVYPKDDHVPASFTILNFPVDDIDTAVKALKAKGVTFEHYDDLTDDGDIARGLTTGRGPDIAWFKDPAGNVLAVLQQD
ncbi:MAG TPA: VOC family protein [Candidatus Saccharimonadia bacterium]|nr:VOC family protein [Candidatus Saccharimonadia bacterium]